MQLIVISLNSLVGRKLARGQGNRTEVYFGYMSNRPPAIEEISGAFIDIPIVM